MVNKTFSSIDDIFGNLKETKGGYSKTFSKIILNNTVDIIKSVYWLIRLTVKPNRKNNIQPTLF